MGGHASRTPTFQILAKSLIIYLVEYVACVTCELTTTHGELGRSPQEMTKVHVYHSRLQAKVDIFNYDNRKRR